MTKKYKIPACESCGHYIDDDHPRSNCYEDVDVCKICTEEIPSPETPKVEIVQVGDWIKFYNNGQLVISTVESIRPQPKYPYDIEYCTTIGATTNYIELRKKQYD